MQLKGYQSILIGVGGLALGAAIYVYYTYNPEAHAWFPQCPFKMLTGLDCPGCGSQRAIHALLHGEFRQAFHHNALLLPVIPYLALGFGYRCVKAPGQELLTWRRILYGEYAIKIFALVVLLYFILRNVCLP